MISVLFSFMLCASDGCFEQTVFCAASTFAYDGHRLVATCAGGSFTSCPGAVFIDNGLLVAVCSQRPITGIHANGFE